MKRRDLFKGTAALLAGTALAPLAVASEPELLTAASLERTMMSIGDKVYWLATDGFYAFDGGKFTNLNA